MFLFLCHYFSFFSFAFLCFPLLHFIFPFFLHSFPLIFFHFLLFPFISFTFPLLSFQIPSIFLLILISLETQGFQEPLFRGANLSGLFRGHRAPGCPLSTKDVCNFLVRASTRNQPVFEELNSSIFWKIYIVYFRTWRVQRETHI